MTVEILQTDIHLLNMRTRMPFRFGISTMTAAPHLFLRVEIAIDGQRGFGVAADFLPPKWFTKNPQSPFKDDVIEMLRVIQQAADAACQLGAAQSVFKLWQNLYAAQACWIAQEKLPPLLGFFGVTLVERAMLDAFCRLTQTSFGEAVRRNTLGIVELAESRHAKPLQSIIARHTVGLTDPITATDIPAAERVDDGLPQSLDQCIRAYGLTHFKIKLSGDPVKDVARLKQLAALLKAECPEYAFTLDGNENFRDLAPFRLLWESLTADDSLTDFLTKLIFVEQPLHRDVALSDSVKQQMHTWPDRPPLIIDESDSTLDSFPTALACGYIGTSHKNCKGIFKGLINAARIAELDRIRPETKWILSGEDLSNVGPVALLQDLAVMATLGIPHVERNGHHYFLGLSYLPEDIQQAVLAAHPDLYRLHDRGYPTLDVRAGKLSTASVTAAPFGMAFELDSARFTPLADWSFASA